jgi:hypothetical protein
LKYEGNRFAEAVETIRGGVLTGAEQTTEYLHALDVIHYEWDEEVAEFYNLILPKALRPANPKEKIYILFDAQNARFLTLDRDRNGAWR